MQYSDIDPAVLDLIKKLDEKYKNSGQDLKSYLEGLLYSDYLNYWDYIHLETLLSLQNTRTNLPDEMIFITYHQFTELFFKLILWEMDQIRQQAGLTMMVFQEKLKRINRYLENLIRSFDIMVEGMDQAQFLQFRMTLLPSSGFQSAQYRLIEITATDLINLLSAEAKTKMAASSVEEMFEEIYWKKGAIEITTGNKTLSLIQFEEKYSETFISRINEVKDNNLWQVFVRKFKNAPDNAPLQEALRTFDAYININWPLAHFKSAVKYLHKEPVDIASTGGTNWQKYLPPRFKKVIFYPELWSEEEKENWGKAWVMKEVFSKEI